MTLTEEQSIQGVRVTLPDGSTAILSQPTTKGRRVHRRQNQHLLVPYQCSSQDFFSEWRYKITQKAGLTEFHVLLACFFTR